MVARAAAWFPPASRRGWSPISMSSRHHSEARNYSPLVCRLGVLSRGWDGVFVGRGGVCVNRLCQHRRRSSEVDSEDATAQANRVAKRAAAERYFQRTGNSSSAPRVPPAPPPRPAAPAAVTRPPRAPAAARPPAGDGGTTSASGAAARSDGGSGSGSGGASSSGSQVHDCVCYFGTCAASC